MQRLERWAARRPPGARRGPPRRRGMDRQYEQREIESAVRRQALIRARWLHARGQSWSRTSERLGVHGATLRRWFAKWHQVRLRPTALGRRPASVERGRRQEILAVFGLMGGEVSVATLQHLFPEASRGELVELKARYRWVLWRRGRRYVHALRWTEPGSVWAMDHTDPPQPIDGVYDKLLAMRDLSSRQQLESLPCETASAALTVSVLEGLFACHGAPLVIKCDNGGALAGELVAKCLQRHGVLALISPPGTPAYNGSIEAGIGALRIRADHAAVRHDHPGYWTSDDIETARRQANETARPWGVRGSTAELEWTRRQRITDAQRAQLHACYQQHERQERAHREIAIDVSLPVLEQRSIDRVAVSRALIELGYLQIRRRRIPQPVSRKKVSNNS